MKYVCVNLQNFEKTKNTNNRKTMKSILSLLTVVTFVTAVKGSWHEDYESYTRAFKKMKSLERQTIFLESLQRVETRTSRVSSFFLSQNTENEHFNHIIRQCEESYVESWDQSVLGHDRRGLQQACSHGSSRLFSYKRKRSFGPSRCD